MKKIISFVLVAIMLLSLVPFAALAVVTETDSNGLVFQKNKKPLGGDNYMDYYTLVDCPDNATSVTIPETFNGLPVGEIKSDCFAACNSITEIHVPKNVFEIEKASIASCSSLVKLTVDSANEVYYSKGNCILEKETNLLVVGCKASVIPTDSKVTTIGAYAFYRCLGITKLVTEPTTEVGALYIPANITVIENEAFCLCANLNSIELSDSVDSLGTNAFQFCGNLQKAELGNNLKVIGNYAFYSCESLTEIVIPESVNKIGNGAFGDCDSLSDIYFEADQLPAEMGNDWVNSEIIETELHFGHNNTEEPSDPQPPVADYDYDTTGNIALNKNYDGEGYSVAGEADYTAGLTDGKASNTLTYDNNWFAFCTSQGDNGINAPDGIGVVFIDLGKIYDIESFKVHAVVGKNVENSGISGPLKVSAYVTDVEGGVYDYVGDLTTDTTDGIAWLTLNKKATGRYVAIDFELDGLFAFINEIAIYETGSVNVPEDPSSSEEPSSEDPSPSEDPSTSEPEDPSNPDQPDPEDPDDNFMLGDVNLNQQIDSMDYVYLKRAYFGTYDLNEKKFVRGDINKNDIIDAMDYVYLKRAYFGTYDLTK